jgi:surfeit locus 1 family protein
LKRNWIVALATVASTSLAIALGLWQLDRAAQKTARYEALVAREREPPLTAATLARTPGAAVEAQRFRHVVVEGRWLPRHTVFLDNRQMRGRVGFFVATPPALDGSTDVVLVQRGFVPRRADDRMAVPPFDTPAGRVRVEGWVDASPGRLYEFAGAASGPIRQNLDLAAFAKETGLALLPVSILERGAAATPADGLARDWPLPSADVHKHHGYAFQWFMIGATIVCLHVWFRIVRPRRRAHR